MSKYKKLKLQLASYESLFDLTKAIQLVALSKLKIAQDQRKKENDCLSSFKKLFSVHPLTESIIQKHILIPVTSDKSCCGSINTNVLDELLSYIDYLKESSKEYMVFLIGKKGKSFFKKNLISFYSKCISNLTKEVMSLLSSTIIFEKINNFQFDRCIVLFNHLYSIFDQGTVYYDILSYDKYVINIYNHLNNGVMLDSVFWMSLLVAQEDDIYFYHDLYSFSFSLILLKSLHENEMSELGGRITAMQNASKNAQELIQKIRLLFNKSRQAYITNELIEIVSCLNSLEFSS